MRSRTTDFNSATSTSGSADPEHKMGDIDLPRGNMNANRHTNAPEGYDEVFTSSIVREEKRFLWEIKDFSSVFDHGVSRAMSFEFEIGRLGTMERHLPRKSRWNVTLDAGSANSNPHLIVQLLHPQDKVIFYRFQATVMDNPQTPSNCSTPKVKFRETCATNLHVHSHLSNSRFRYPLSPNLGLDDPLVSPEFVGTIVSPHWSLKDYIRQQDGSLLISVEMEIIENSIAS